MLNQQIALEMRLLKAYASAWDMIYDIIQKDLLEAQRKREAGYRKARDATARN